MKTSLILFTLIISSIGLFKDKTNNQNGNKIEYKLLIYATINDSTTIRRNDTIWEGKYSCIELKIDTIFSSAIKYFKGSTKEFYYHNQIFNKRQLFDTKEYNKLKEFEIIDFTVYPMWDCFGGVDSIMKSDSSCLSESQKKYLKKHIIFYRKTPAGINKIFFENIKASNKKGEIIELNSVICFVNK